jgi:type VI secretion system protein ImpK
MGQDMKSDTRLVACFIPLLAQLRAFAGQTSGDAHTQAAELDLSIADARRVANDAGVSDADVDAALFAVAAWADETLIGASWPGAVQWQAHLLQRRYFNVNNAGVGFFTRLDALTPEQMPVRAVYYLCLAMGFGGRYAYDRNQKALSDIKRANLSMLLAGQPRFGAEGDAPLFPDGYAALPATAPASRGRFSWLTRRWSRRTVGFALIPTLLVLLLLGAFHIALTQSVQSVQIIPALMTHVTL